MLADVGHVVEPGMVTYKGLPAPLVCAFLSGERSRSHYAPGTGFHIGTIEMVANAAALSRRVHSVLLAADDPIVEHLRGLAQLPGDDFRFFAVPVKVKGLGTFPVRAFGLVEETA